MTKCCVIGCKLDQRPKHRLPKNKQIRLLWINAINRQDVLTFDEKKIRSLVICNAHFSSECYYESHKIKHTLATGTIPDTNLPGKSNVTQPRETGPLANRFGIYEEHNYVQSSTVGQTLGSPRSNDPNCVIFTSYRKRAMLKYLNKWKSKLEKPIKDADATEDSAVSSVSKEKLVEEIAQLKRKNIRLFNFVNKNKQRLRNAARFSSYFESNVENSATARFLLSQLQQHHLSPAGRRFSFDDKIYALSLMKMNMQGYNLLQNTFALPSKTTAYTLVNNFSIGCSINKNVMNALKLAVDTMSIKDTHCVLMFSEITMNPDVLYNSKFDRIDGLAHKGSVRKKQFANHATVFMAKGLARQWKIPVAYFFSFSLKSEESLSEDIKKVIFALRKVGLQVVATVCPDSNHNAKAITHLQNTGRKHLLEKGLQCKGVGFTIGDNVEPIIPLFDVPQMMIRLRNEFRDKDFRYSMRGHNMLASWIDIQNFFKLDEINDVPLCNKLSSQHVNDRQLNRYSVHMAAQLFSSRVASSMLYAAKIPDNIEMINIEGTAKFIEFVNNLFDSSNCSSSQKNGSSALKACVRPKTSHVAFWKEAIKVLSTVRSVKYNATPQLMTNWIKTLVGFDSLWKILQTKQFKSMSCANLNAQEMTDFFDSIRNKAEKYNYPKPIAFMNAYKQMFVNNLMSSDSLVAAKTEDDDNMQKILRTLFTDEYKGGSVEFSFLNIPLLPLELSDETLHLFGEDIPIVMDSLKRIDKSCKGCIEVLSSDRESETHRSLMTLIINALNISGYLVENHFNEENLIAKITSFCKKKLSLSTNCQFHDLLNSSIKICAKIKVDDWINTKNH